MTRYLGGLITKDESLVIPSNNFEDTSAPGVWTLEEAQALNKQGLWPTAGNANPAKFIENVFSIDTYTGNGSARTITTGIDLVNNSGLVWIKNRTSAESHFLCDTVRGAPNHLVSNTTAVQTSFNNSFGAFTSTGFTLAGAADVVNSAGNNKDYVAWTFRKAPKFFDIVSWSGDNVDGRTISHDLGATPGFIIVKLYSGSGTENWICFHRSLTTNRTLYLNTTATESNTGMITNVTSTGFDVDNSVAMNATGRSYVAYIFGHDTSSDGMIQCDTFTPDGNGEASVNLGFEPQFIIMKQVDGYPASWYIFDTLRGMNHDFRENLYPNLSNAADITTTDNTIFPTATGFEIGGSFGNQKYVYIAIRRGNMQTPTARSDVFEVAYPTGASGKPNFKTSTFPVDLALRTDDLSGGGQGTFVQDRLRGTKAGLRTHGTDSESFNNSSQEMDFINGFSTDAGSGTNVIAHMWRRAPGYFDIVPYTGNSTAGRTINHSLGVVPDMIWFKIRESANAAINYARGWVVTSLHLPNATATNDTTLYLDTNGAEVDQAIMNDTGPTSTVFSVGSDPYVNFLNTTYVAYLFANLTGISKIGTFSHTNGSSTDVDCGFSSGSRWVLVKRTDSTGSWYVWDSLRGIVSGNDSYILLDDSAAQVTNQDYIDPLNSGFQIASGFTTGTYFFYAIAA